MADILPLRIPPAEPPAYPTTPALVVDAAELAGLLRVGLRTVRTWDAAGKLPAPVRIGGAVRWRLDEVRAWLAAGAPDRDEWDARRASPKK